MKRSVAVSLTIGIILLPIIATIIYGLALFNAIKVTSIISIPLFVIILLGHLAIVYITYKKYDRRSDYVCRLAAPYYDFFLLVLQIVFVIFGIVLAVLNMKHNSGKCAFVSTANDDNNDDDANTVISTYEVHLRSVLDFQHTSEQPRLTTADDMDDGSASCGGVTIVFWIACIILCMKLFTLPKFRDLSNLRKQSRAGSMHPMAMDPRIRVTAVSMHETFNAPSSSSHVPRLPLSSPSRRVRAHTHHHLSPRTYEHHSRPPARTTTAADQPATTSFFQSPTAPSIDATTEQPQGFFLNVPSAPPPTYEESVRGTPPQYANLC